MRSFSRMVEWATLSALFVAVGCGSSGGDGEFSAGADNDPECPETLEEFETDATIPADANCSYANLVTGGNVEVEQGANLTLEGGVIGGNVQASSWSEVILVDTAIAGNFQISGGPGVEIDGAVIDGNLQISGITGPVVLTNTEVMGDVQVESCSEGTIEIGDTTVGGNLDCSENESTFEIEGITVSGERTGQCEE